MNEFENGQEQNEHDEIANIYAMEDFKREHWEKTLKEVDKFYGEFENVSPRESILRIKGLIKRNELTVDVVHSLLDNMINVFEKTEEYEKCAICLKIKKGIK